MKTHDVPAHVTALLRAVEIAGGQTQLAAGIKQYFVDRPEISGGRTSVCQQTVWYWINRCVLLDAIWWPAIEHVTKGGVTRADLRPDVFHVAA